MPSLFPLFSLLSPLITYPLSSPLSPLITYPLSFLLSPLMTCVGVLTAGMDPDPASFKSVHLQVPTPLIHNPLATPSPLALFPLP